MKLTIIGTHGLPARYGGFETFAERLAKACTDAGIQVRVVNDKSNPASPAPPNVEIVTSSYNKSDSPIRFYKDSLKLAADSDVILCCGVGGAYYFRNSNSRNYKIVTNIDGMEHLRTKYSVVQRWIVYLLQRYATHRSDFIVADSLEIWGYWTRRFPGNNHKFKIITYGTDKCLPFDPSALSKFGLEKNEYFLAITRQVPENHLHEIIEAYKSYLGKKKLVIVGGPENSAYSKKLRSTAGNNIIFTGGIYDKSILDSLRQGCFIYLHGHSVGGTNPSLLEAMAAGCASICHENVFNREVTAGGQMYFDNGADLAIMLNILEHKSDLEAYKARALKRIAEKYSWDKNCAVYIDLFNRLHAGIRWKSLRDSNE